MSIETLLAELTTAIKENTVAHAKLADVAVAASKGKAAAPKEEPKEAPKEEPEESEDEAPKETAAAKKKRLAAEKKKAEAEAKTVEKPELEEAVGHDALHKLAGKFLATDDEAERDTNKGNFVGALAHLGAKKLTDLADDSERARVAGYITYWMAGLEVDFDEIDALIPVAEGDDDPLG